MILPGHCLQDLVDEDGSDLDAIASIRGMGTRRYARYGAELAGVLAAPPAAETEPQAPPAETKP